MFNSSPITSWEGAGAFFNWAGTDGAVLWVCVTIVLCVIPILIALKSESAVEREYRK